MDISNQIASNITTYCKYGRYLPKEKRRETWEETVNRCKDMHIRKFPEQKKIIEEAFKYVRLKKILPSMRSLQFGGRAIELNNSRIYNCAFMSADYPRFFNELMFLLLGGTGVGYSVQWRHVSKLPAITNPGKERKYVIQDSIVGWADAVKALFSAYFEGKRYPRFDYSDIRPLGSPLKTAGGKAPGPGPLRTCLARIAGLLENKAVGSKLQSYEVCDIACFIADAVLAGGIRRSAMICIFDMDDDAMLSYKTGSWWDTHPQRGRVNVSAVAMRDDLYSPVPIIRKMEFIAETERETWDQFWTYVQNSGSGEPGVYWSNDPEWGCNPCVEIALRSKQFCNLTTINYTDVESQEELNKRAYLASIIGTLQASYTDLHYLSDEWKVNCQNEALLGVSVTGIADGGHYKKYSWKEAAKKVIEANEFLSKQIGIKAAARLTCIKPEGTASLVLGSSSGVHARHSHYYIRRIRLGKNEPIAIYLANHHPELVVQDKMKPDGVIVEIPQKAPDRSIYRTESPIDLLERVKYFHENWVMPGHKSGINQHNVSCTISVKPEEWDMVGEWMWRNRSFYNGISVLPYDGGTYVQAPFEECDKATFDRMMESLKKVDLTKIREDEDETTLQNEAACAGGACEI